MMKHPDKRKRLQARPLPMGKKSRVFLAVYSAAVLCVCFSAGASSKSVCLFKVTTRPSAATAFSRWPVV